VSHASHWHRELDRAFAETLARDGDAAGGHALLPSRRRLQDLRTMTSQSRVLFAVLTECESAAGKPYLRGWAGASNLVAFPGKPDEQGRPTWNLFLVARAPRPEYSAVVPEPRGKAAHQAQQPLTRPGLTRRQAAKAARRERLVQAAAERRACAEASSEELDDEMPF
jgi:hypothetical protein